MTPHMNAKIDDIKEVVIMPGDPLRAKFVAENFLENARLVNNTRLALAYTGTYKGKEITVMSSGMGMPSMSIYAYELYNVYNVKKIIRIGTCGALHKEINLKDIIVAEKAYTSSNFAYQYSGEHQDIIKSSVDLNEEVLKTAKELELPIKLGVVNTSDVFYHDFYDKRVEENYSLATEMESFALFYIANKCMKEATAILTVSDNIITKEQISSKEREQNLKSAINLALETAVKI